MSDFSQQLAIETELWIRECRSSLYAFAGEVLAAENRKPAAHHRLLIAELERVSSGETPRLLITMPPGSATSTYVSKIFPAWWLALHPRSHIINASHTATLAESFSGDVQRIIREHSETLGYSLATEPRDLSETTLGSRYLSCGAGQGIAGFRADIAILDDIVRNRADADSELMRNKTWEWFVSDLLPRLRPEARIVVVMTRWHEDDIGGRLLQRQPGRWKVLRLPAFADAEDDPLRRAEGAPLWDDDGYGYGGELLTKRDEYEDAGMAREWHALYMQNPRPPSGSMFDVGKIRVLDYLKELPLEVVRAWDLASSTGKHSDFTAGVKLARMHDKSLVVLDVIRFRGTPDQVEARIVETALADGTGVKVLLPVDPGSAGLFQSAYLTRQLMGFPVESSRETGPKETRAQPVASQSNVGNVSIYKGLWNAAYLDELASFPAGRHDDMVDALSRAFAQLLPDSIGVHLRLLDGGGRDRLYGLYGASLQ